MRQNNVVNVFHTTPRPLEGIGKAMVEEPFRHNLATANRHYAFKKHTKRQHRLLSLLEAIDNVQKKMIMSRELDDFII